MNNLTSLESTLDCVNGYPSIAEFWKYLLQDRKRILIVLLPLTFSALIMWVYSINLKNILNNCNGKPFKKNCILLVSIYPIVSVFSMVAICVPRTYFFNDSIGHIAFMVISWELYSLFMIYIDGEGNFISIANNDAFTLRAPPLCCCFPFKRSPITKNKFKFIKFLIIQLPITHIGIFLILNIIYIEDVNAFDNVILFFIPFIAVTVLLGIWGYNLAVRTFAPYFSHLKLVQKYFAFQLVLFFCKIFPILLNFIMKQIIKSCNGPMTIVVKRHTFVQILVQIEMFLLSLWTYFLYRVPLDKK